MSIAISFILLFYPKKVARVFVLIRKWIYREDISSMERPIAYYSRLAGIGILLFEGCRLALPFMWKP